MQQHRCDQTPPLEETENKQETGSAESELRIADQSPQYGQASTLTHGSDGKPAHTQHQNVGNQQNRRDRRFVIAKEPGELFAESGKGKAQAGAAFVAARGLDAHKSAAHGAELWAGLLLAAEKSAHGVFPAF